MKDKPTEWIAISDLMAGVTAVVMLLLVTAVLQKSVSELNYQQELAKAEERAALERSQRKDPAEQLKLALQTLMNDEGASSVMMLDAKSNRLTLADSVFERGSACLRSEVKTSVSSVREKLLDFLRENANAQILVEGYTDNIPVNRPVIDFQRFCAVYDDNYTLSAARAREVRKSLVGTLDETLAKRIVVAGYGDSRPLADADPADPKNRRVEVKFIVDTSEIQQG